MLYSPCPYSSVLVEDLVLSVELQRCPQLAGDAVVPEAPRVRLPDRRLTPASSRPSEELALACAEGSHIA